ncbi:glycylpeptide N-tetradecanoyltransferase [Pichia californica]|uniref:Glycylpeptide N-tetradecanoyltransferase n=1 Tax=Pichia californica TaxID=460514 RepID=A0A9P7BC99_9ASCO|nr:glycylpeptide N-tetradecanoyltransferase [[Candida] californica]KAG0686657.1 glycylpeptide N-tetradecanoyltransferase [[Candida] californica]
MSENKGQKTLADLKDESTKKTLADLFQRLAVEQEPEAPDAPPKSMDEYKFWKTQPVPRFDEKDSFKEGPIDAEKTIADVRTEPYPIHSSFEWTTLDLESDEDLDQLYELLYDHYVEDHDATFRFAYSRTFFNWALKPPGWEHNWHIGVRVKDTGRLIAFISGVPCDLTIRGNDIKSVEINFLCVHKQLRSKRLAPLLIKEVTRRVNLKNIWQALYSSGTVLPKPLSTCRYGHRPLNWGKLYEVGFSSLPQGETKASMIAKTTLSNETKTVGWRKMKEEDIDTVYKLYNDWRVRYEISQIMTKEDVKHWIYGGKQQDGKVIHTYVVEDKDTKRVTDFISFYVLPFTVLQNELHDNVGIAYLYYYASETGLGKFIKDEESQELLKKRLKSLVNDAMIEAKKINIDVFNALSSQDNALFLDDLKFGAGDGFLNYYVFNYRAKHIEGGIDDTTNAFSKTSSGVGVVLL